MHRVTETWLMRQLADVGVEIKRALLSPSSINWDDPRFGDRTPCRYGGREGVLRDTVCVIVSMTRRVHLDR